MGPEGAQAETEERGPLAHWAQFRLGPSKGARGPQSLQVQSPQAHDLGEAASQVKLVGFDVLELLAELQEGGPRGGVQLPAVLHDLVDCKRAAVRGIHLVALLHPRDDIFQGLRALGW